jgi:hypothetical protein
LGTLSCCLFSAPPSPCELQVPSEKTSSSPYVLHGPGEAVENLLEDIPRPHHGPTELKTPGARYICVLISSLRDSDTPQSLRIPASD